MPIIPVIEYLWKVTKYPPKPICVVFGDDAFLRSSAVRHLRDQVLAADDAEFSLSLFEGDNKNTTFKEVLQELRTVAMFGGGQRLVRVDDADSFVTKYRTEFETYAEKPSEQSVLIVQLKAFDSRTKLYKKLVDSALVIEAKSESEKKMPTWVEQWSKHQYKTVCEPAAAKMIVERIGAEHGLLDQELSKLSLMVTDAQKGITTELVAQAVGSWRVRKVYDMLDLALEGKTAAALCQLNVLLTTDAKNEGKDATAILNMILPNLQKMAAATELILDAERRNVKMSVPSALQKAGVHSYYVDKTAAQLKQLGRYRGAKLLRWLLQLDHAMKGGSRSDDRRALLEAFIVKISSPQLREANPTLQ